MSKNTINSETSDNNNSPTSSQTIQAMAAFLSLSMTQALLTSNLETPTNKEHRPNDKNEDSATDDDATAVATLEEDTAVSVPLQESGTTLHQKEGDRVLAMQDTFFTEPNSLTPPSSSNTDDVDKEGLDATTALSATKEEVFSAPPRETASEVLQLQRDSSSGDSSIFTATSSSSDLIPAVPGSISLAFGRPLVAFQERVPPLRLENSILSQSSNNHTPIANGSTTAQKQQAQPESGVSAASPKILDAIIIRDNDPYGE